MNKKNIQITECPRDAMQGIKEFIPTALKIEYLNNLLSCNFDVLDFGSFVSSKAIPQLHDTAQVLAKLNLNKNTKLLAIVANTRGAIDTCNFEEINFLGFPFSVSETFQQRNTNSSINDSFNALADIQNLCVKNNKQLRVYLSMAFGNPYNDVWHEDIVTTWAQKINAMGIKNIALSDTIGSSTKENITSLFTSVIKNLKDTNVIAHLHSTPETAYIKIDSALNAGCTSFDTAIKGYGGCPMAADNLTGNIATEVLLNNIKEKYNTHIDSSFFNKALEKSNNIFLKYH